MPYRKKELTSPFKIKTIVTALHYIMMSQSIHYLICTCLEFNFYSDSLVQCLLKMLLDQYWDCDSILLLVDLYITCDNKVLLTVCEEHNLIYFFQFLAFVAK